MMPRSISEPWTHDKGLAAQLHGRLRLLRNLCWAILLGRLDHVANHGVNGSRLSLELEESQLGQGGPAWSRNEHDDLLARCALQIAPEQNSTLDRLVLGAFSR